MSHSPADRALQAGALTASGVPLRDGEVPAHRAAQASARRSDQEKALAIAEEGAGAAARAGLAGASDALARGRQRALPGWRSGKRDQNQPGSKHRVSLSPPKRAPDDSRTRRSAAWASRCPTNKQGVNRRSKAGDGADDMDRTDRTISQTASRRAFGAAGDSAAGTTRQVSCSADHR